MEESSMNSKETARLIVWFENNGLPAEKATECLKFIATGISPEPSKDPEQKTE